MKRILITEDDRFMANVCRQQFTDAGYEVAIAHDGHAAVEELVARPPDIVLLDLNLPGIDGVGVLRFLRSRETLCELPVIVVSNSAYFSGEVQAAWSAGATHFLNKGDCSPKMLVDEVARVLRPPPLDRPLPSEEPREFLPSVPPPLPPRANREATGPVRVLIADDDKTIHGVLNFFMTQAGFLVKSAYDGTQALEMAQAEAPDIMVLDGMMPKLSGFEVLERWLDHPYLCNVPVIMLTGNKDDPRKADALANGVVDYLTKPFSPDELVHKIIHFVGRSG